MYQDPLSDEVGIFDKLYYKFGIREGIDTTKICDEVRHGYPERAIQLIAKQFEISFKFRLSLYKGGNDGDWSNVSAKIQIPNHVPFYGSDELKNTVFNIRVDGNIINKPETFVTCMAHEIAHILMYSTSDLLAKNEHATDILAMMQGFYLVIEIGRKAKHGFQIVNETGREMYGPQTTTTYGYLDDEQFSRVNTAIRNKISIFVMDKINIRNEIKKIDLLFSENEIKRKKLSKYLKDVKQKTKKRINGGDIERLISLYDQQYSYRADHKLDEMKYGSKEIKQMLDEKHYTEKLKGDYEKTLYILKDETELLHSLNIKLQTDISFITTLYTLKNRFNEWVQGIWGRDGSS